MIWSEWHNSLLSDVPDKGSPEHRNNTAIALASSEFQSFSKHPAVVAYIERLTQGQARHSIPRVIVNWQRPFSS